MSWRLYIGDIDRDNGIWDWALGTKSEAQEIASVVEDAKKFSSISVYMGPGSADVAMALYRYIASEEEWMLDCNTYFKAHSKFPVDPEVDACVQEIDRLEWERQG